MSHSTIAVIPARGSSKRIPRKNVLPLRGLPVIAYSILHAKAAKRVDEVYVSTEDGEIAAIAAAHGAVVVHRPQELAGDEATSESALLHVLDHRCRQGLADPDRVVFLQCTSPVRSRDAIDLAVAQLDEEQADSLFSACVNNRLIWGRAAGGAPTPLTYDYESRRREQEMEIQYRENGSIYVFRPWVLRQRNNRLGGRIAVHVMDYWESFQIDEPEHFQLMEWILANPRYQLDLGWPKRLDVIIFDFDGVMTDNAVFVDQAGQEMVRCSRGDGWGLARLREAGLPAMVLSTERNSVVAARCEKLHLPCHQGIADKAAHLRVLLAEMGIAPEHAAFVGNDVNDLGCLQLVGFPIAVGDSHPGVLAAAHLTLRGHGGQGAVRELCDLLLARIHGGLLQVGAVSEG